MKKFKELRSSVVDESFELDEAMGPLSKKQIDQLKKAYGSIDKINVTGPAYKKMKKWIASLDKEDLTTLAKAKVKWVSQFAANELRLTHNIKLPAKDWFVEGVELDEAEDNMPASPDEAGMAMDQAKFIGYVAEEIMEYVQGGNEFPEWMQNKLTAFHEKAKGMHAVMAGKYDEANK